MACTNPAVTVPAGSIEMVYTNAECAVTYTPYATVSDTVAAQWIAWCETYYGVTPAAACFSAAFDAVVASWLANIQVSQTTPPAKLSITPAQ
jgi:hypothetical protein